MREEDEGPREAEEALRESEERFRALVESSLFSIGVYQDGKVVYVNPAGVRLLRAGGEEEVLGRSIEEIVHPGDREAARDRIRRMLKGETGLYPVSYRYLCLDGSAVPVEVSAAPCSYGGEPAIQVIALDLTERRRTRAALKEVAEWHETVFEGSRDAIFISDEGSRLVSVNQAAEELTGYARDELLAMRIPDLHEDVDLEAYRVYHDRIMAGESALTEAPILRKDGTKVEVEFNNRRVMIGGQAYMHTVARDITPRMEAESALRESEERLALAVAAANQGLYDLNVQTGEAVINDEYAVMLGYRGAEALEETNEKWRRRLHPDDREHVYRAYEDYVAGRRDSYRVEFRQKRTDGNWIWILSVGKLVEWDAEGSPLRMLGTHTDLTELKAVEEELRNSETRLRALAAKLESVREEERASVARELHDQLGQAMTSLRMDLASIRERLAVQGSAFAPEIADLIVTTDETLDLVRDISARLRPPILDILGLEAALEWLAESQESRSDLDIRVEVPPDRLGLDKNLAISVFRVAQEAITNILRHAEADTAWVRLRKEGEAIVLEVEDDGRGVPEGTLESTLSLGLTGMRERALRLGGGLELVAPDDGGTLVRLRFVPGKKPGRGSP